MSTSTFANARPFGMVFFEARESKTGAMALQGPHLMGGLDVWVS